MKYAYLIPLAALVFSASSHAQSRIFRCGNSYTNDAAEAKTKNCKLVEGGYITVVEGTRVQGASSGGVWRARPRTPRRTPAPYP